MIQNFLLSLEAVRRATTQVEREAIYRFRYDVYVTELGKKAVGSSDAAIHDPEDDHPDTLLLYTGKPEALTGTMRLEIWPPGKISRAAQEKFSTRQFHDIDAHRTSEMGRLIVRKSSRGKLIVPALVRAGFEELCERQIYFTFCYCAPGLVAAYRRLGTRPYSGNLIPTADGLRVPMVGISSDVDYLRRNNSPLAPIAARYFGRGGKFPPLDLEPYRPLIGGQSSPVEADPEEVWRQMESELLQGEVPSSRLLGAVLPTEAKSLSKKGFLMNVPAGETVIRANLLDRELFVILDGIFEVVAEDGRRIALLHKGEVFGEIAFFLESGRRSASIRSLSAGTLFVLRRKFIQELLDEDPKLAAALLLNLSGILAQRLEGMIREIQATQS